ncbi:MAG: sortase domain-bontaining protein [Thiobacillus sp.]
MRLFNKFKYKLTALLAVSVILVGGVKITCDTYGICGQASISDADSKIISSKPQTQKENTVTQPVRMIIPAIELAVNVDSATVDLATNNWPLSDTSAQYANFTPGLGSSDGTMLIYGHHTWEVLRRTDNIKIGDELNLIDNKGRVWRFSLAKQQDVVPTDIGFIYEKTPFRVVAFTCNGPNDQYRRLMFFKPI